jgi:hypothetical protein
MTYFKHIIFAILLCIFSVPSFAQEIPPKFEDFPAQPVPPDQRSMKPDVDLQSHPKAYEHRKHLMHAMRRGPNFAGHYVLTSWECGLNNCRTVAIIDTTTGVVYFPQELAFLGAGLLQFQEDGPWNKEPLSYQQGSKLLIVTGYPTPDGGTRKEGGTFYYVWENGQLNLIAQINTSTPKTLP